MRFEDLDLHPDILKAVRQQGFVEPTAIQQSCIPLIKAGRDLVGQSLTGSGKTAAFGLPLLEKIVSGQGVQALILTPTRELAAQVKEQMVHFAAFRRTTVTSVYGGVGMQPQIDALRRADVVVATPGRLLDHIRNRTIVLRNVKILVLDEADKMFEMGFIDDVRKIISALPTERQTLLFSATVPSEVHRLVRQYLREPAVIKEQTHVDHSLLKQVYYDVPQEEKFSLLVHLLKQKTSGLAIVFCLTRHQVDALARNLKLQNLSVMAVHGGLSQNKRSHAVDSLKNKKIQILVATDVAARGLDISNISHIYNYEAPKSASEYTHRIGRTARAGKEGDAVTLLSNRDYANFRAVQSDPHLKINKEPLPAYERIPFVRSYHREGSFSGKPYRGGPHRHQRFGSRFGPRRGPQQRR